MKDKLVLVTGAAGFCASRLIEELLSRGYKVRATDLEGVSLERISGYLDRIEFRAADITKPETIKPLLKDVEVVFHPAAIFSYSVPLELLRKVNVEGTRNIIELSIKEGVSKMVVWSSVAAYGAADPKFYKLPIRECSVEEMNPAIKGKYDLSKREQEAVVVKYWEENKFPISILRPAPMYGPGSYYGIYTLFKYIEEELLSVVPSNLANNRASMPLVNVKDVAKAAIFLSEKNKGDGESYNIVDDNTLDLVETIRYIALLTNSKVEVIFPLPMKLTYYLLKLFSKWSLWEAKKLRKKVNGKPPIPYLESDLLVYLLGNFWFSNQKIKGLGFEFDYPDRSIGLIETIDWYNKNGWEKTMAIKGSEQIKEGK